MNKKKLEIVKKIENIEDLSKYLSAEFRKIVGNNTLIQY